MNVPGKSPSVWRVVVIAGAGAVLASAMTPAFAAAPARKSAIARKRAAATASRGGGAGPPSLEWTISAMLRP